MTIFEKGAITLLGCALVFALVALPLVLRRIPPNRIYGYRTCATLADEALWYDANAHFGRGMLLASAVMALAVPALRQLTGLRADAFLAITTAVLVVPSLVAALATWRFIRAWKRNDPSRTPR